MCSAYVKIYFDLINAFPFVHHSCNLGSLECLKENHNNQLWKSDFIVQIGLLGPREHFDCYFLSRID